MINPTTAGSHFTTWQIQIKYLGEHGWTTTENDSSIIKNFDTNYLKSLNWSQNCG